MTDEISFGGKRNILLLPIALTVVYIFLSIFSVKISFWILIVVVIIAIFFVALSHRSKSSVSLEPTESEPVERKRGLLLLPRGGLAEFYVLIIAIVIGLVVTIHFYLRL